MQVTSSAFKNGERLPKRYSCDGEDLSPPLSWSDAPGNVRSFAVFCDDPDAPSGTFHHWAVYDIPKVVTALAEGFAPEGASSPIKQGKNDFGKAGYGGACPPRGHGTHHYHFKVMALDCEHLDAHGKNRAAEIQSLARKHCIATAELVGLYSR
jgi:Raf kinase inhibitor-like YbhB/YbcL family protein